MCCLRPLCVEALPRQRCNGFHYHYYYYYWVAVADAAVALLLLGVEFAAFGAAFGGAGWAASQIPMAFAAAGASLRVAVAAEVEAADSVVVAASRSECCQLKTE